VIDDPVLIDLELRQIANAVQSHKWRAADLVLRMEKVKGWRALEDPTTSKPFASKTNWLLSCVGASKSAVYEAVKHRKALPELSVQSLDAVTQQNLKYLKLLPERARTDEEVLEKAKGSEADFVAYLNETHGLHVTAGRKLVVDFDDAGQYEDVSEAVKTYAEANGCSRADALWEMVME
jgi:hypothetical protein